MCLTQNIVDIIMAVLWQEIETNKQETYESWMYTSCGFTLLVQIADAWLSHRTLLEVKILTVH